MSEIGHSRIVPFPTSNEQFLRAIFEDRWGEALVAYFPGDPDPRVNSLVNWTTYPAATVLRVLTPEMNTYWDVSLPAPGGGRTAADFAELRAIVLDDVGVKVDRARAVEILGCEPSFTNETSPGSFQAGWIVEPLTDQAWVAGMLRALHAALGGDNLDKMTTLVRLPVGTNGKAKYGPGGFRVRLVEWHPERRIRHTDWIDIEARLGGIIARMPAITQRLGLKVPDISEVEADPIFRILRDQGRLLDQGHMGTIGWCYNVLCPWAGEGGHDDPSGTAYFPIRLEFVCHHGHCLDRTMDDVKAWANEIIKEDSGGLLNLPALDFDDVTPAITPGQDDRTEGWDLWDNASSSSWPGGIHRDTVETEARAVAAGNGFDRAGFCIALVGAGSAAADKRAMLRAYRDVSWTVPPIVWVMLIGSSGSRKTGIWELVLKDLQTAHDVAIKQWISEQARYRAQPLAYRQATPPPEIKPLLVNDATVEGIQNALSHTSRGLAYVRDEMDAILDFDRYAQIPGGGRSGRSFYLEAYEAKPFTLIRVKRGGLYVKNSGVTLCGGIQREVVGKYLEDTGDGLMQRFVKHILGEAETYAAALHGIPEIEAALERIRKHVPQQEYTTTAASEAMIRETEAEGRMLAATTHLGPAFASEAHKMHGLHARVALVLHLMDDPNTYVVSDDAVRRAKRFVNYVMETSAFIYAEAGPRATAQAIGSWLLRKMPPKITARDLMRNVAICRGKHIKVLNEMMEPLVTGGWVQPGSPYPTNKTWLVNQNLQKQFPERLVEETARVEAAREAMNQFGQFRPPKAYLEPTSVD